MQSSPSLALPIRDAAPPTAEAAWDALDDPAEWRNFSRPVKGREGCWESYLAIEGMHCAACTLVVEDALAGVAGVETVQVNGAAATARVVWRGERPGAARWLAALRKAGYGAMPAADLADAAPRQRAQRVMLWRWLVAGFCMMQAMMYAYPMYIAGPEEITPDIQALLRWGAWMMVLPVMLFSCWPFFSSALRDLRNRRVGMDVPVALGILIAFGASTAATFDPSGPWGDEVWYDSVTMFVFFLLSGRLLEQRLRDRTAGSLEALLRALPASVERLRPDGSFARVPVRALAVGDTIRVLPGEAIPADGRVEAGDSRVDEALLTGESAPLARRAGDAVIAGSNNLSGTLQVRVERVGADTRFAGIVALMERASVDKPALALLADRIASPFLLLVLAAACGAAAWWWPSGPAHALGIAVAVLIVTCPCALSLATPAAMLAAAGALARRGVLVRQLQALETAATVDTVVFDKTGTLTQDRMDVARVHVRPGAPQAEVQAAAAALAAQSLHPAARAVAALGGAALPQMAQVVELPGQGLRGRVETGLLRGVSLRLGSARLCGAPASSDAAASGGPQVHLADDAGWLASFELTESMRPDAAQAVAALRRMGVAVQLLSGDREQAARALAARAGIDHWRGACTPEDKLAHVQALQRAGARVMMVGDGMNDAPVLACADVSVAMGQGVPLAQTRSDFIAQGGQLGAVALLLAQSRRSRRLVRQNLLWAALYNAACVPLAVAGMMPPWLAGLGMAASSLLVVANSARLARVPAQLAAAQGRAATSLQPQD